jgi:hypothetical protein
MPADSDNLPAILLTEPAAPVPAVIAARGHHAGRRFVEFFTANIRNPNTRKAYYRAAMEFFNWCDQARLGLLAGCGKSRLVMSFWVLMER